jgi:hypothetical protein
LSATPQTPPADPLRTLLLRAAKSTPDRLVRQWLMRLARRGQSATRAPVMRSSRPADRKGGT